jgi:hypothetical protein
MKSIPVVLLVIVSYTLVLNSCSKTGGVPPVHNKQLIAAIAKFGTDSAQYTYHYNSGGQITSVTLKSANEPEYTEVEVSYQPNQIRIIEHPSPSDTISRVTDTIYLFLAGDTTVTKRVHIEVSLRDDPGHVNHMYTHDTSNMHYNASGKLMNVTYSNSDSQWYNLTSSGYIVHRVTGTLTYSTTGGNVTQSNDLNTSIQTESQPPYLYVTKTSNETNLTFDYAQMFPNKTDFSNTVVMSELAFFIPRYVYLGFPVLPSAGTYAFTAKDENGNVTYTYSSQSSYNYTYNADGWLETFTSSAQSDQIVRLVYGN